MHIGEFCLKKAAKKAIGIKMSTQNSTCLFIEGGHKLSGEIKISGAKNAALPALAATILAPGEFLFKNMPWLLDVSTMLELLCRLGAHYDSLDDTLSVDTSVLEHYEASYELVTRMRASILVLGPLLARKGKARVALPGGCDIGKRPVNFHLKGLAALGAKYSLEKGYINVKAPRRLRGAEIIFDFPSVTATENIMMAAVLARGKTIIGNAAREPEVVFLGEMLNLMGAKIKGLGTENIVIEGVKELSPVEITIIPDRIEAGTYLMAPGLAGGELILTHVNPHHLSTVIAKLREIGLEIEEDGDKLRSRRKRSLKPTTVRTAPYPGFPTDLQAQIMALLSKASGTSVIVETVFENRFKHAEELRRMGADIVLEGQVAVVRGVKKLQAAPVKATDLRASASLVLAGLGADGVTEIAQINHLKRGYEALTEKLSKVGAKIWEAPCQAT